MPVRVAIVHRSPRFRNVFRREIESRGGVIVAEASTAHEARILIATVFPNLQPHIVVIAACLGDGPDDGQRVDDYLATAYYDDRIVSIALTDECAPDAAWSIRPVHCRSSDSETVQQLADAVFEEAPDTYALEAEETAQYAFSLNEDEERDEFNRRCSVVRR